MDALASFLLEFDDGRVRHPRKDRPFRKLYRRAKVAIDQGKWSWLAVEYFMEAAMDKPAMDLCDGVMPYNHSPPSRTKNIH